jgi:hypothetical protein
MTGIPLARVAPKARQHLSADALLRLVHTGFAHLPAYRPADVEMALPDVRRSAFALFSRKAPARLAVDTARAAGHVPTIYGRQRVPCDPSRRARLAPVSPTWLRPVCTSGWRPLQRGKALAALPFLAGASLWALDGTASFSSKTMHGASGVHRVPRHGSITSTH